MIRFLWLLAGCFSLALGLAGAVLPLLPTVPFVLLAAFCFARSSERFHAYLIEHPRFGPMIEGWQSRRAIPKRAKWAASASMAASLCLTALIGLNPPVLLAQAIALGAVAIYIWTRPAT